MNSQRRSKRRCDTRRARASARAHRTRERHMRKASKRNVVELRPGADPILALIGEYWNAIHLWQRSHRRLERLRKTFDESVTRQPRVQIGRLLKGKNADGCDNYEPIYAHSEYGLKEEARRYRDQELSHWASPGWIPDQNSKSGFRRGPVTDAHKTRRKTIRARWRSWYETKLAELNADKTALTARQRASGWLVAVEAEQASKTQIYNLRSKIVCSRPTTLLAASALAEFLHKAENMESRSRNSRAPYGLGQYYTKVIAKTLSAFLSDQNAAFKRKAA